MITPLHRKIEKRYNATKNITNIDYYDKQNINKKNCNVIPSFMHVPI